jgi:hypothetical protein
MLQFGVLEMLRFVMEAFGIIVRGYVKKLSKGF